MKRMMQSQSLPVLLQQYQIPDAISQSTLKHGELVMDKHILYELVQNINTDEQQHINNFVNARNTFYRNDVILNMPHIKPLSDISDELKTTYLVSKSRNGYKCPHCSSNNTAIISIQMRSCDEGETSFLKCYNCNAKIKNPDLKV